MTGKAVRLHKYLAQCQVASRRRSEELIIGGQVFVNGRRITELGTSIDPVKDKVRVGRREIRPAALGIILLHKPKGVVSTMSDPEGRPTVAMYLSSHYRGYFPVGRLDFDSSGLVVMTNDGEMAQRLLHPRYGFERIYELEILGRISDGEIGQLSRGVKLEDGLVRAQADIFAGDARCTSLRIVVKEGRNRIVRRLIERFGCKVLKLKRIAHGPFRLGRLRNGQIRKLTEKEYRAVRNKVMRQGQG